MANILIFGASGTYGAWDRKGGWAQRLRGFLDEKTLSGLYEHLIYNLGVSGNTTEDLLERFEFETKQRLKEEKEEPIFIFLTGMNDSQFIHSKNQVRFTPEQYKDNLEKLLNLAQKFSLKIIFMGLWPVDETKTTPIPWNADKSYKNEYIQKFNEILRVFCKENKVPFIEIFDKLMNIDYKNLLEDGLHPDSEGHQKIFEIVKDFLIKNKII